MKTANCKELYPPEGNLSYQGMCGAWRGLGQGPATLGSMVTCSRQGWRLRLPPAHLVGEDLLKQDLFPHISVPGSAACLDALVPKSTLPQPPVGFSPPLQLGLGAELEGYTCRSLQGCSLSGQ